MSPADIFLSLPVLRSGERRYLDLSDYSFSANEKVFICEELAGLHHILDPTHINKTNGHTKVTANGLADRHHVASSTIYGWKQIYEHNGILHSDGGRPALLDQQAKEHLKENIVNAMNSRETIPQSKFPQLVQQEVAATLRRSGQQILDNDIPAPSDSFLQKLKQKEHIIARKPQSLTDARLAALRDIRAAYRVACMYEAFSGHLPATNKWNADATTALVQEDGSGDLQLFVHEAGHQYDTKFDSVSVPNQMGIMVKWVAMASAYGEMSPPVLMFTLPTMAENTFFAHEVPGMSGATEIGGVGWLYLSRSRGGTSELWRHWHLNVVIPTLKKCLEYHQCRDASGELLRIVFSTDGELKPMVEAFDAEVLQGYMEALVDYLKGEPATTSFWQSLDVAALFRCFKAGLKQLTKTAAYPRNETLRAHMQATFREFQAQFPSVDITATYKNKVIDAVEKIVEVMRNKYVTPAMLAKGFVASGQHRDITAPGQSSVNFDKIITSSLAEHITDEERQHMMEGVEVMIHKFWTNGRILDSDLDALHIPRDPSVPSRDDLILSRQTCQLLTHADTVTRYRAYIARRDAPQPHAEVAAAAGGLQLPAGANRAQKRAFSVLQSAQRQEHAKAQKVAARAAEQERWRGLSKAEQQEETAAKRAAAQAVKDQKAAAKAAKLAEAEQILTQAT